MASFATTAEPPSSNGPAPRPAGLWMTSAAKASLPSEGSARSLRFARGKGDMVEFARGAPSTFLFTDLESSTALWEHQREAMAVALARHDEILRAMVKAHRGRIFATGGDGFGAVFAAAADAIVCAVEAQRALVAESWPEGARLLSRMGLHTGEAEQRDDNFFGATLN